MRFAIFSGNPVESLDFKPATNHLSTHQFESNIRICSLRQIIFLLANCLHSTFVKGLKIFNSFTEVFNPNFTLFFLLSISYCLCKYIYLRVAPVTTN